MSEDKPKRKPRAKKAEAKVEPKQVIQKPVKEQQKALSVAEIQALPQSDRKAALELHAKIGDDKKWAKVMLNVSKP